MKRFTNSDCEPQDVIVSLARLHRKKGFDFLIRAFQHVVTKRSGAMLLIGGGDDGELSNLRQLVESEGLTTSVHFVGPLDHSEKVAFLAGADAFALCSHSENFGNAYVEALAAGLPIVATHGTPWAAVENQRCGRWVELSAAHVAEALLDVLTMDRSQTARAARAFAEEFSNARVGQAFLNTYNQMLKERGNERGAHQDHSRPV